MAYWTAAGLSGLAQSESSGRPDLVHYPTGYTPQGTKSSASGLYGFLDSTWKTYAGQAGVDVSQYPRAYMAPADVQTKVAAITPISNWTCPGCNATASRLAQSSANITATPNSQIPAGPPDSSSGVNAGSSASGSQPPGSSSTAQPPQGQPVQLALQPEEQTTVLGMFKAVFVGLENWFVRGGLIIFGVILVIVGLIALMWERGGGDAVKKYAPLLAAA